MRQRNPRAKRARVKPTKAPEPTWADVRKTYGLRFNWHLFRAGWLLRRGRYEECLRALDAAIGLNPGYADAHGGRGDALWLLGRYEEAVWAYREAVRLDPEDAEKRIELGAALLESGREQEAEEQFAEARRLRHGIEIP